MTPRARLRLGILLQVLALVVLIGAGVWWFSVSRPRPEQTAADPTVTTFVNQVRGSLATEQARPGR